MVTFTALTSLRPTDRVAATWISTPTPTLSPSPTPHPLHPPHPPQATLLSRDELTGSLVQVRLLAITFEDEEATPRSGSEEDVDASESTDSDPIDSDDSGRC